MFYHAKYILIEKCLNKIQEEEKRGQENLIILSRK